MFLISDKSFAEFYMTTTSEFTPGSGINFMRPAPMRVAVSVPLDYMLAAFCFVTAVFHMVACFPWCHNLYMKQITIGVNVFRWAEYCITAPIMAVVIAWLVGIKDLITLSILAGIVSIMQFFGLTSDITNLVTRDAKASFRRLRFVPYVMGSAPLMVFVYSILLSLFGNEWFIQSASPPPPDFVYVIIITELALFSSFSFPLWYQLIVDTRHYWKGEVVYIVLSMSSKVFLVVMLLVNIKQFS